MPATTAFRNTNIGFFQRIMAFFALMSAVATEAFAMHRDFVRRNGSND